jgi:hypothetical protein
VGKYLDWGRKSGGMPPRDTDQPGQINGKYSWDASCIRVNIEKLTCIDYNGLEFSEYGKR